MIEVGLRRKAVVVLGMHRSGTSALAGLLGDLGCGLPGDLLAAEPMNPKGFVESASLSALDDEVMATLGSSWFDWRPLTVDPASPELTSFAGRAVDVVSETYGDEPVVVVKDPRICRLVPFWQDVLSRCQLDARYVLTHRQPDEVAASLDTWAGYAPEYGELLWLRYVLDAEHSTRGAPRVFVDYDLVLGDPQRVAARVEDGLGVELAGRGRAAAFLDPALRRSIAHAGSAARSPWVTLVLEVLDRWVADGEDSADHERLDVARHALDQSSASIAALVDGGRVRDVERRRLAARLAESAAETERLQRDLTTLAQRAREAEVVHAEGITRLEAQLRQVEHQRDMLRRRSASDLRDAVSRAIAADRAARRDLDGAAAHRREMNVLRERLEELERDNDALRRSTSWRMTAPLRHTSRAVRRLRPSGDVR